MGEEGRRIGGLSSGLAVLLNGDDNKENPNRNRLVSHCDDFGHQSVERTLERIFDIPFKSISPLSKPIESSAVSSIINDTILKFHKTSDGFSTDSGGATVVNNGCGHGVVGLDESSMRGDIRTIKPPLVVESFAIFSSCRFNVCVWKGKWMYEVILGTSGVQQIGWATFSCPFTDLMGVGDSDDSYAFDGRRVTKWNKNPEAYGQSWVVGDVIGCCIDLDHSEISFYRNGISLGVAFRGVHKMEPGFGYYPAISLSQGERCELNFGAHPFRYPVQGFLALQDPPSVYPLCKQLIQCWSRLFEMQRIEKTEITSVDKLRRFRRFMTLDEIFQPVSHGICRELLAAIKSEAGSAQYLGWGLILSFMLEVYGAQSPHDHTSLDRVVDVLLEFPGSFAIFEHVFDALSSSCKTAPFVLTDCPYSGSYPYLAVVCHIFGREELMLLWWRSSHFDFLFEGFLSRKSPNKHDLQFMIPSVYWPGSSEDVSSENSMMLTTTALARAINKIEEKHRELCRLVMQFRPPVMPQYPGSAFRSFLRNVLFKNRGADRNLPPLGVSSNSVLVSLYTVILYFLSEGFCSWIKGCGSKAGSDVGFLHRGGQQSFPLRLFLQDDPHRVDISRLGGSFSHLSKSHSVNELEEEVIRWDEGCMDDEENRVTHSSRQKPCCCSTSDVDLARISKIPIRFSSKSSRGHCSSIPERSAHVATECSAGSLNDEITNKPSSSDRSESEYGYRSVQHVRTVPRESNVSTETLLEEELLDAMLLLYQLGLTPNFKQASYYTSHQTQSLSLLEETDRHIRERGCVEQLKHLKEARNLYREEVSDCVRHSAWYRISLFSKWKQRGMYATCMWIAHLVLVLSKRDSVFPYIPEFYLESLVDCFHVLRKSDPPFVPSAIFIKQGLGPFVTFIVTHFNDSRISSADVRDLLLQSISVLVQYKEFLADFENNEAATERMPKALLTAFDNRSWIPVTNILLRLCKGSGFGSSKHGESSSSSIVFQTLLREACVSDEQMFSNFLNRLFNMLSWTMTEFSVSVREMQEKYQVLEFQQRKCSVIFDLSCNLARVLEFCTHEIPQAFLVGTDTNLRRLAELIVFILNHITSVADAEFLDLSLRRNGQNPEKVNRGMILAPLVGIMLNLLDGRMDREGAIQNDVVRVFASMDCLDTVYCGFQYLLEYNWAGSFRTDGDLWKLQHLEKFQSLLISQTEVQQTETGCGGETDSQETMCCICYACEADAQFAPCSHRSCFGCITRHMLNCQRCFFCNTTVLEVSRIDNR